MRAPVAEPTRFLVVRRDNIGDLVCTTPLFAALRRKFPNAWIGALVNSYNAAVLHRNPDIDALVVYTKLKHLDAGDSKVAALARRLLDLWRLRRRRLDYVLLATPQFVSRTVHLARILGPRCIVGFADGSASARGLDLSLPPSQVEGKHEVERVYALATHFGIGEPIPALKVIPDPHTVRKAQAQFAGRHGLKIGVQISTRRPGQRWPVESFTELVRRLHALGAVPMLLWSPGPGEDPRHPGDDETAMRIVQAVGGELPLIAYRAGPLSELIGALAACDAVVTPDGGAMHLAAGLNKPIVCFFGDMDPARWRPWGVPHRVLRPASRKVADVTVEEAVQALNELTL